jgi:hypothetical protein
MLIPKADRKKIHELVYLNTCHHCGAIETWTFTRNIQTLSLSFILTPLHLMLRANLANSISLGTSSEVSIPHCTRAMAMAQLYILAALLHIRIG